MTKHKQSLIFSILCFALAIILFIVVVYGWMAYGSKLGDFELSVIKENCDVGFVVDGEDIGDKPLEFDNTKPGDNFSLTMRVANTSMQDGFVTVTLELPACPIIDNSNNVIADMRDIFAIQYQNLLIPGEFETVNLSNQLKIELYKNLPIVKGQILNLDIKIIFLTQSSVAPQTDINVFQGGQLVLTKLVIAINEKIN